MPRELLHREDSCPGRARGSRWRCGRVPLPGILRESGNGCSDESICVPLRVPERIAFFLKRFSVQQDKRAIRGIPAISTGFPLRTSAAPFRCSQNPVSVRSMLLCTVSRTSPPSHPRRDRMAFAARRRLKRAQETRRSCSVRYVLPDSAVFSSSSDGWF